MARHHCPMIWRTVLLLLTISATAQADPRRYTLDQARSQTYFFYEFSGQAVRGTFPVSRADLVIDFTALQNSHIDVIADVTRTQAGFAFATQALKGPAMLDAATHPEIHFVATRIRRDGDGASVQGDLTIRGVTHPVTLSASIFRQQGTAEGDLSRLSILLEGTISRSAFGADGFADMVGDSVRLKILARIDAEG